MGSLILVTLVEDAVQSIFYIPETLYHPTSLW